jgi:putative Mg2+ transporter-C (MgtC) family protein
MTNEEILLRLGVALFLGMLIGFERIYHKHDAGVRTHAITAMGACLFMMTGIMIGGYADNAFLHQEVWRALAQILGSIIVGIGFLGAGLIFTTDKSNHKKGLTSAATLWTTAAIGAACAFGFISMAVITTLLVLFTLTLMASLEWTLVKFFKKDNI